MSLPSLSERYPTIFDDSLPAVELRVRDCLDMQEAPPGTSLLALLQNTEFEPEEMEQQYAQAEELIKRAWIERRVVVTFADLGLPAGEENAGIVLPILARLPEALASAILDSVVE